MGENRLHIILHLSSIWHFRPFFLFYNFFKHIFVYLKRPSIGPILEDRDKKARGFKTLLASDAYLVIFGYKNVPSNQIECFIESHQFSKLV